MTITTKGCWFHVLTHLQEFSITWRKYFSTGSREASRLERREQEQSNLMIILKYAYSFVAKKIVALPKINLVMKQGIAPDTETARGL